VYRKTYVVKRTRSCW